MALTIWDDSISSDRTTHTVRLTPGGHRLWEVSWLPAAPWIATAPSPPWCSPT